MGYQRQTVYQSLLDNPDSPQIPSFAPSMKLHAPAPVPPPLHPVQRNVGNLGTGKPCADNERLRPVLYLHVGTVGQYPARAMAQGRR